MTIKVKPQISRRIRRTAFFACAAIVIPGAGLASPFQAPSPQQPAATSSSPAKADPTGTPAAAQKLVRDDLALWLPIIKASGASAE